MGNSHTQRSSRVDGETVRTVLFVERLHQSELASRLGVDQTTVSRWMTGSVPVPPWVRHVLSCRRCYEHFIQERHMESDR